KGGTMKNKIEEAKRKKNILVARAKRAEAQKTIQATMAGLSDTSAFDTFDRMAEKVEQIEAEAEAGVELAGEMTGDTLQSRFKQLESTGGGRNGPRRPEGEEGGGAGGGGGREEGAPQGGRAARRRRDE